MVIFLVLVGNELGIQFKYCTAILISLVVPELTLFGKLHCNLSLRIFVFLSPFVA
jgi:hypothetical protein